MGSVLDPAKVPRVMRRVRSSGTGVPLRLGAAAQLMFLAVMLASGCRFDTSGIRIAPADVASAQDLAGEMGGPEAGAPDAVQSDTAQLDTIQPDTQPDTRPPLLPLGAACTTTMQCSSGYCVNNAGGSGKICCDSPCYGNDCNSNGRGCD